jgi:type IV secretion system T-DNA border endonuclease VirD2
MAEEQHSFDEVVDAFHDKINQAERVVADAPVERRAALEHELNDIYRSLSHLSPMGAQSHTLLEDASKSGIYSAANIRAEAEGALQEKALTERLEQALKGTGIDAQEVTRRVEIGAGNAALERQWLGQDLKAIAEQEGFDLSRADELEKAIDRLDQVHSDLGRALADAEVLKDSGAVEADRQEAIVDSLPPTTSDILRRMRDDPTADPFRSDLERETFRAELEELVGKEGTPDLAIGDDTTLEEHMSDRLDRLYAAKAYLQSDAALTNSMAMEHVLDEIANEEIDVQRERHVDTDGENGVTHG